MCRQLRHVLSLCLLNLIPLPSYLSNREGRCFSSLGFGSTCQFSFSYKISQDDSPCCSMHTCSFILCYSSSESSSWSLRAPLETLTCLFFCSGGFLAFFFLFESTFESPATKAWSLEGLMVPIITNLSCSCVRDSMNSASLGIFQVSTWWHGRSKKTLNSQGQASRVWPKLVALPSFQFHTVLATKQGL